jgi:undecaprenyl-diphosphatase
VTVEALWWQAAVLGVVEGLTEFIPVSSTGHLIVAGTAIGFPDDKSKAFEIFIQLGAVIAVAWHYRRRLLDLGAGFVGDPSARAFVGKILVAFLPAALVGLKFHDWIEERLFSPLPVAASFAVGGLLLLAIDRPGRGAVADGAHRDPDWRQAALIGLAQVLALWPGFSRSGATIIGGLLVGLSRSAALEFSFFLALPTLGAASLFALYKVRAALGAADLPVFAIGLVTSFVVSLVVIKGLLRYVATRDFRGFGVYRLAAAALIVAWWGLRAS